MVMLSEKSPSRCFLTSSMSLKFVLMFLLKAAISSLILAKLWSFEKVPLLSAAVNVTSFEKSS